MIIGTLIGLVLAIGGGDPPTTPCHYEDSVRCVWDAKHMGDGNGRSFVAIGKRSDPTIIYVTHRVAHKLIAGR